MRSKSTWKEHHYGYISNTSNLHLSISYTTNLMTHTCANYMRPRLLIILMCEVHTVACVVLVVIQGHMGWWERFSVAYHCYVRLCNRSFPCFHTACDEARWRPTIGIRPSVDQLIPGITLTSPHGSPPPPILVNVKGMTPLGTLLQYWH